MAAECRQLKDLGFYSKKDKGKDDNKKDGEDQGDPGFQQPKGVVAIIFGEVPSSSNKW